MHRFVFSCLIVCVIAMTLAVVRTAIADLARSRAAAIDARAYVSNYGTGRDGIYLVELDSSGVPRRLREVAALKNVQFLALHPNRKVLYATCDIDEYEKSKSGAVTAFKIEPETGDLTQLNHQSSEGELPCHVSVDREGKFVFVANYMGANAAVLPIRADGGLSPATSVVRHEGSSINKLRQTRPHPHAINPDPKNRFVLVADLGIDQVLSYELDASKGALAANDPPGLRVTPGAGPRHLAFHPGGKWLYVINELNSTISAIRYDSESGSLALIDTVSTLPADAKVENITGEIAVHPNGKYLYGSNRGHDTIAVFAIDATLGKLTPIQHHPAGGRTPRNFNIDPSGKFLLSANLDSDSVTVHQIDDATGKLSPTGQSINVEKPHCIEFLP